jgi:hypothetical protein
MSRNSAEWLKTPSFPNSHFVDSRIYTDEMNSKTLAAVKMPNRDGFIVDDRPDTNAVRCMTNCK